MEIRNLLVILFLLAGATSSGARVIKTLPLDPRRVYTVAVGTDVPTTCVFPGPLGAMATAGLSDKAEALPPVLIAHQPGTAWFTVRALLPDARAALNVFYGNETYVIDLVGSATPDRLVRLTGPDQGEVGLPAMRALIGRAREIALGGSAETVPQVDRAAPGNVTLHRGFRAVVEEVFRFDAEGVLVFRIRLENEMGTPVRIVPAGVAVRVGREVFPASVSDGSSAIPPKASSVVWFAVRAPVGVSASFSVLVPTQS
jgi:hypothetical protein